MKIQPVRRMQRGACLLPPQLGAVAPTSELLSPLKLQQPKSRGAPLPRVSPRAASNRAWNWDWLRFKRDERFTEAVCLAGTGWMAAKASVLSAFQTRSRQRGAPPDWESGTGKTLDFDACGVSVGFEQPKQRAFAVPEQRKQCCPLACCWACVGTNGLGLTQLLLTRTSYVDNKTPGLYLALC